MQNILNHTIVGQRRTSKNKPFVILYQGYALKGPYREESKRWKRVWELTPILREWNLPFVVLPIGQVTILGELYSVFPNLLQGEEIITEEVGEIFSDYRYSIIKESNLVPLSQVSTDEYSQHMEDLLYTLVALSILQVGDLNLRNILWHREKKELYLVDFDDTRAQEGQGKYFYFNRPPADKYGWQWVNELYHRVADRISNLSMMDSVRKDIAIQLLRTYAGEQPGPIGRMVVQGGFQPSTTYSGFHDDVVKSGLQKYIRRGDQRALLCAVELYRLGELEGGTGKVTNLKNRMDIIAVEDIGIADWKIIRAVLSAKKNNLKEILSLTGAMVACRKTRIGSHLNRKYCTLPYTSSRVGEPLALFATCILEKNLEAIHHASNYLKAMEGQKVKVSRSKRTDPAVRLWEVLESGGNSVDYLLMIGLLEEGYFAHQREKHIFLIVAIMLSIYWEQIAEDTTPELQEYDIQPYMRGEYTLTIDDYVVDKHTREGRKQGKGRAEFVREGALVTNQDPRFYDQELERLYIGE